MTKGRNFIIILLSIVIPALVALLYFLPKSDTVGDQVYLLPKLNAFLNGTTSILLVLAFLAIRKGKKEVHKGLMLSALGLSVLFLLSYVSYHSLAPLHLIWRRRNIKRHLLFCFA